MSKLVTDIEQIEQNIAEWSTYLHDMQAYKIDNGTRIHNIQMLFRRGVNYVVAKTPKGIVFIPSTFAAVIGSTHKNYANPSTGEDATNAINKLLGKCKPNKNCAAEIKNRGRGITTAKFWVIGKIKLNSKKKSGKRKYPKPLNEETKEGIRRLQEIELISRSATLAKACKERDEYTCQACGFKCDFGNAAVICHHKIMVSASGTRKITDIKKLVTLCPTCHSIAHMNGNKKNPLTIKAIQKVLREHCQRPKYK